MKIERYQKEEAIAYAKKWAYLRNPAYYNFDPVGGDCTNFISQCLFEAGKTMNHEQNGWYYYSGNQKSPSWTGVEYLYQFLIHNKAVGPFGKEVALEETQIGDIVQLSFDGEKFSHSLLIVEKKQEEIKVATHTFDSYGRSLSSYMYKKIRGIHIQGIRKW